MSFPILIGRAWLEVNIQSGVRRSRHYLPGMLARDTGRIIFICSEAALTADPDVAPPGSTAKFRQLSIAHSQAQRTQGTSVAVKAYFPAATLPRASAALWPQTGPRPSSAA